MAGKTRDRMVDSAIKLLQEHGLATMSFTDVVAESGAARGAIYHHFPGGKQQLVAEAAERNGEGIRAHFSALPGETVQQVVEAFLESVRPVIERSAGGAGCAVAAVTIDGGVGIQDQAALLRVAAGAFAGWEIELRARLVASGATDQAARGLSTLMVATLEGAHVLCRAAASIGPFDRAAAAMRALVANAT